MSTERIHALQREGALVVLCLLPLLCGCPPPQQTPITPSLPPPPPREMEDIVGRVQSNAAKLDKALWSNNINVIAHFQDEDGAVQTQNLEGSLLFDLPLRLLVDLRPGLGDKVMQIGSNDNEYWSWIELETNTMWWGLHRHIGKPGVTRVIASPDQMIAALGVAGLPRAQDGFIGPARKFGKSSDILYYMKPRSSGGYDLTREYWIDRAEPWQIRAVVYRDHLGQVAMSAYLDDLRVAWEDGPVVAHKVNMKWPKENSSLTLQVGSFRGMSVKPEVFERPTGRRLPVGVRDNIIQVDRECEVIEEVGDGSPDDR